jgi:hypothetical protein
MGIVECASGSVRALIVKKLHAEILHMSPIAVSFTWHLYCGYLSRTTIHVKSLKEGVHDGQFGYLFPRQMPVL